jgi:hypothetical protein
MKSAMILAVGFVLLGAASSSSFAQSSPTVNISKFAPPTNVRVEAGQYAIKVSWDASLDEANYKLAGYNVYFDTQPSALLVPNQLPHEVQLGRGGRACVIRGLENGRQYFFHVRARALDGSISAASLPELEAAPQLDAKNYAVAMYDDVVASSTKDIAGFRNVTQHGKYVDILMMESPAARNVSLFVSPSEADFNQRWPYRNRTLIADVGTDWVIADSLPDAAFATTAEIKNGHVYVLRTHDDYHVKLRVDSIKEVTLLLPLEAQRRDAILNKVTFTYASQLGQSYEDFLTGKP